MRYLRNAIASSLCLLGVNACNQDNCLRAVVNDGVVGAAFCASFTATTYTAIASPTRYVQSCASDVFRVSSACACLGTATCPGLPTITVTATATTLATTVASTTSDITLPASTNTATATVTSTSTVTSYVTSDFSFTSTATATITSYVTSDFSFTSTTTVTSIVSTTSDITLPAVTQTSTVITTILGYACPQASAINLFVNPGFETGDISPWTFTGGPATGQQISTVQTHSGTYSENPIYAGFGGPLSFTLVQQVPLCPNAGYTLSFWAVAKLGSCTLKSDINGVLGPASQFNLASTYQQYTTTFTTGATGGLIPVGIANDNCNADLYLDDFLLTPAS